MPNSTRAHRVDDRVDRMVVVLERDNVRSLLYFAFARAGLTRCTYCHPATG